MKYFSFRMIIGGGGEGAHISSSRAEIHKQIKALTHFAIPLSFYVSGVMSYHCKCQNPKP